MNDNTQHPEKKFFDLHTSGIGYLNRARSVTPTQGEPYESVSIAALHGRSDSPSYSYIDTRIVGSEAREFVMAHKEAINDRNHKVLVRFKVGDGEASSYEVKSGENQGKRNHVIKARLLQITWASIDGEVVLRTERTAEHDGGDPDPGEGERSSAEPSDGNDLPVDTLAEPAADQDVDLTDVVKLDPNDPDFAARKKRLKESGYRWDSGEQVWRRQAA